MGSIDLKINLLKKLLVHDFGLLVGGRVVQYSDKFMHSIVLYYIHITID